MNSISKKKVSYKIVEELFIYLEDFGRLVNLPFRYPDLLRYNYSVPLMDKYGKDTLWETVYFQPSETEELNQKLVQTYAMMKVEGTCPSWNICMSTVWIIVPSGIPVLSGSV